MSWTSEVSSRSPILWFKLDETSGTTFANSGSTGSGFNGTGHGGLTLNQATLGSGLPGGSVLFNGSTGYISVPAGALTGLTAITVLAWIKTSSTTSFLEIVSSHTGTNTSAFQWRLSSGGTHQEVIIPVNPSATTSDGSGTINNGAAHLGGFTYTSGAKHIYRDGSSEFTSATTGAINGTDGGFDIGAQPLSGPSLFFNGSIQEVVIFNTALSAADITTLYNAGSAISGTASASLGALVAAAGSSRTLFRPAAAVLGGMVASATGVRTDQGTAASSLGGVAAAVTGIRTDHGTASAPLGGLTASAASAHAVNGTAAAVLGALTASAPGITTVPGSASAQMGGLTATAAGVRTVHGTANAALGALIAAAVGTRADVASASAALGVLTAAATGTRTRTGVALADLGALIAAAIGTVTGVVVAPVAGPFRWGFTMLVPSKALIPVEAGLDFIEWGFVMLQPGDALIGDPA